MTKLRKRNLKQALKSKRGMTLVEALIAGAILLVVGLMVADGFGGMAALTLHSTNMKNESAELSTLVASGQGVAQDSYNINLGYGIDLTGQIVRYNMKEQDALNPAAGEDTNRIGINYYTYQYLPQ
ncbi:type II secretion system GspH family protein [Christensenellaceae bacterium OttesenSCG-928-L17]|nr:type II secretion system GspH family protein [Christensenellaceae bacterium OttesenSCG-928-L17]